MNTVKSMILSKLIRPHCHIHSPKLLRVAPIKNPIHSLTIRHINNGNFKEGNNQMEQGKKQNMKHQNNDGIVYKTNYKAKPNKYSELKSGKGGEKIYMKKVIKCQSSDYSKSGPDAVSEIMSISNVNTGNILTSDPEKKLAALKMEYELLKYEMEARGLVRSSNTTNHLEANNYDQGVDPSEPYSEEMSGAVDLSEPANKVPNHVSDKAWQHLLLLETRSHRLRYYRYLFKNEMADANLSEKKARLRLIREAEKSRIREEAGDHILYGLGQNSMFFYLRDSTMKTMWRSNLALTRGFGEPNIAIDMDFEHAMSALEKSETANQVREMFHINRTDRRPFNLNLFNCESRFMKPNTVSVASGAGRSAAAAARHPSLMELVRSRVVDLSEMFMDFSERSYTDFHPKQNLIYLSPNSQEYMKDYDPNAVYVIGALVERGRSKPYSLAKAKREGIKTLKLPIDKYLRWGNGGKDLTLNQVMGIMLDIKNTGSWDIALRHVPRRKLYQASQEEESQDRRFKNILRST